MSKSKTLYRQIKTLYVPLYMRLWGLYDRFSGPGRTRTNIPPFVKRLLCPLSYGAILSPVVKATAGDFL